MSILHFRLASLDYRYVHDAPIITIFIIHFTSIDHIAPNFQILWRWFYLIGYYFL